MLQSGQIKPSYQQIDFKPIEQENPPQDLTKVLKEELEIFNNEISKLDFNQF